ncbi:MAG: hypothetical protein WD768_01330 [Phycisphaeraceae bacterium]
MRTLVLILFLMTSSGCGDTSTPHQPTNPLDGMVKTFKPGTKFTLGNLTWTAQTIERIDEFTLSFGDMTMESIEPAGETVKQSARKVIYRFHPPDMIQAEMLDVTTGDPNDGFSFSAERMVLPAMKVSTGDGK